MTTNSVPGNENVLQISAGTDAFVAVGKSPDASLTVGNDSSALHFRSASIRKVA